MATNEPLTLADLKALGAASAESGPDKIVFLSGYGKSAGNAFVPVETPMGNVGYVIVTPPKWASERLLKMFSGRATALVSGECPSCGAMREDALDAMRMTHEDDCDVCDENAISLYLQEQDLHTKTKRNDPCHCGSGRKFKHCHGS